MKRITLFIAVLLASAGLFAQDNDSEGPVMKFDESLINENGQVVYDYGTIAQNSDGTSEFTFKNAGKEPLVLSRVRSSCGCTVPTWPRKPIMPGQVRGDKSKI
ncbi:MAG: DUF1573 domain-containing protein [Bacteroidales bacterium]|nr:DUF1573 domain-containing protein [Bacteroidales bacterium]